MKPLIRKYDKYVGEKIGALPKAWYGFLDWLCIVASPIGWSAVILAGFILAVYLKDDSLARLSIATLVLLPLAEFVKLIFRRPRPLSMYAESMRLKSYSFPSGHAYSVALACGYIVLYASVFIDGVWLWLMGVFLAALAIVVAGARVYLKAHFPSDVTVGLLFGVLVISLIKGWFV